MKTTVTQQHYRIPKAQQMICSGWSHQKEKNTLCDNDLLAACVMIHH